MAVICNTLIDSNQNKQSNQVDILLEKEATSKDEDIADLHSLSSGSLLKQSTSLIVDISGIELILFYFSF